MLFTNTKKKITKVIMTLPFKKKIMILSILFFKIIRERWHCPNVHLHDIMLTVAKSSITFLTNLGLLYSFYVFFLRYYNNYHVGEFVLYRHTTLPYEVIKYLICIIIRLDLSNLLEHTLLLFLHYKISTIIETSTMPSCSGPIPAQQSRGNSVLGVVFSHTMLKMDFHYSHRVS